jgi:hypothetical protein
MNYKITKNYYTYQWHVKEWKTVISAATDTRRHAACANERTNSGAVINVMSSVSSSRNKKLNMFDDDLISRKMWSHRYQLELNVAEKLASSDDNRIMQFKDNPDTLFEVDQSVCVFTIKVIKILIILWYSWSQGMQRTWNLGKGVKTWSEHMSLYASAGSQISIFISARLILLYVLCSHSARWRTR